MANESGERIAIFGGTFDPIHNAHVALAVTAREQFKLNRVLLIPAANPPHKNHLERENYEHRYRMVELACEGIEGLEASRLEEGDATSFSIETIKRVRSRVSSQDTLFFLIGADAFAEVRTWFQWRDVIRAVEFIVVSRPGHLIARPKGAVVHTLGTVSMEISSSAIRAQLANGIEPLDLSTRVFEYIEEHNLYNWWPVSAD